MKQWMGPEELSTIATLEATMYCPKCATDLGTGGFASAYWQAETTIYFCWCEHCGWMGEITEMSEVFGIEAVTTPVASRHGRAQLSVV